MNEQDIAAADTILLMEAEEKVKMRILQVVSDVIKGYSNSVVSDKYVTGVIELRNHLQVIVREESRNMIQTSRIQPTL